MEHTLIIPGRLPGLNEYTEANRRNPHLGGKMKRASEAEVMSAVRAQLRGLRIMRPVRLHFIWYEPNRRRDHDNVSSFGRKVIQDALVRAGVLRDDGWDEVIGFTDAFVLDRRNPRIVVNIEEQAGD